MCSVVSYSLKFIDFINVETFFLIEVWLTYIIILVSRVQHNDWTIVYIMQHSAPEV